MAVALIARAGSTFRADVEYRNPPSSPTQDPQAQPLIDTTGYHARLQIRAASGNRRVILSTNESSGVSAVLSPDTSTLHGGRWHIFLPASITRTLPPTVYVEVELVSNSNVDDVTSLFSGTIRTSPEQVN